MGQAWGGVEASGSAFIVVGDGFDHTRGSGRGNAKSDWKGEGVLKIEGGRGEVQLGMGRVSLPRTRDFTRLKED